MDEVYYMYADAAQKSGNTEEAALYLDKIAEGFPYSNIFEPSKQRLIALKQPVPSVNEKLAALNRSRVKEESFNPIRVLSQIAGAMGFNPPPDIYNETQKTLEKKQAEQGKTGEESGAQIKAVITKSSSGESSETHVISSDSTDAQPGDSPAKKKPVTKNKRQRPD
jgi:hypothetical protein